MYLHFFSSNIKIDPHLIYVLKTVRPDRIYIDTAAKFVIDYHANINVQYAMCIPSIVFHSSSLHLSVTLQNHSGNIHTEKIQYSVSDFFPYLTIHIHSRKDVPISKKILCI